MLTIRAMSNGRGYSSRHLEHSDYYAEGERVVGRWQGRGAEMLGIGGEVKPGDFEALRQGLDPDTGKFLRQRRSADRIGADSTTQSHGRHLYDFTISAPKSVSVLADLGGDRRLIEAHQRAVAEALRELELHAAARIRKKGANQDSPTGNLVIAVYHHDTSRELDPQLHTHAVAANLTFDNLEGRWKALQASGIYERRSYLTEVYRNALAREVRLLGYEIESRRNGKGRDCGFEIRGIPDAVLERFSQRSRQRDEAVRRFIEEKGRPPTDNEIAILVRDSRADKLLEVSTEAVKAFQRARLTIEESRQLKSFAGKARSGDISFDGSNPSLQYAKDHVFERVSVTKDHEILGEALRHGRGRISCQELKRSLALEESSGAILRHGDEIATKASLRREREMIDCINRGIGACPRLGGNFWFEPAARLSPEQRQVVEFVLDSRDRAVNIRGAAGTGKTATLEELRRGLIESGQRLLAVAPTRSAVEELHKVGFKDAVTIERFLQDRDLQAGPANRVVIVDEAGMVSGRQMGEMLRLAEGISARIVFSGDTKQIQSVEACDALRVLEKESRLQSVELQQVQRQIAREYREAIKELRRDPEKGLGMLDSMGAVREIMWGDRPHAVAQAFAEAEDKGRSALVVCATHEEIDRVTEAIRLSRKRLGRLGPGVQIGKMVSLNWTEAQKCDLGNFRPGQILVFHRAVKGISKNEVLDVGPVTEKGVTVRNRLGEERLLTARQAKSFDVCERHDFEIAAGDRLLLTANRQEAGFRAVNGEVVTVECIDSMKRVHLEDGRILPENFRQFTHGYAVTAHRSQGKSVDTVIISADGMRKELFYVAASRGRESVLVITSDKESLRESVARSNARQSASELARRLQPGLRQGLYRGFEAACRLARHAAMYMHRQWEQVRMTPALSMPKSELGHETVLGSNLHGENKPTMEHNPVMELKPVMKPAPVMEAPCDLDFDR
jgi:conjugative relaxase-like TrwC/TraI family protein